MVTGAAGGVAVALVILVLVVREAVRPGPALTRSTVPLLLSAGALLAARALTVIR